MSALRRGYAALERFGFRVFRRLDTFYSKLWSGPLSELRRFTGRAAAWPVAPGAYIVGDRLGTIAVCTLTSGALNRAIAALPGVAIAGRLYTCNLGIEKIILNVCANPRIGILMLCGQESRLFRPGQSLRALAEQGIGPDMRIVGAQGYLPVLRGVSIAAVEQFRRQVILVDRSGELDVTTIGKEIAGLARQLTPAEGRAARQEITDAVCGYDENQFIVLRPGGKRESLAYDPKGNFIITLDPQSRRIVAHHYLPDMTPAHVMRSSSGEAMVLALIQAGLVTQLTHAAYLGAEFAKAETALRLGSIYEQDQPMRNLT